MQAKSERGTASSMEASVSQPVVARLSPRHTVASRELEFPAPDKVGDIPSIDGYGDMRDWCSGTEGFFTIWRFVKGLYTCVRVSVQKHALRRAER